MTSLKQGDKLQSPEDGRRFVVVSRAKNRRRLLGFECPENPGDFWHASAIRKLANRAAQYDGRGIQVFECIAQQLACDGSLDGPGW